MSHLRFCRPTLTRNSDAACDKQTWLPAIRMTLCQSRATKSRDKIAGDLALTAGVCCILRPVRPIWPVHGSYTGWGGRCGRCMVYTDRIEHVLFCYQIEHMFYFATGYRYETLAVIGPRVTHTNRATAMQFDNQWNGYGGVDCNRLRSRGLRFSTGGNGDFGFLAKKSWGVNRFGRFLASS